MIDTDTSQQKVASKPTIWPVALVGAVVALVIVLGGLRAADWDITLFLTVGEDSIEFHDWLEPMFGEVHKRAGFGHDGKYFFVQALDPWILDPETYVSLLDRPIYRAQRMFYPTLAGGLGLFTPDMTLYGMLGMNVLAMFLGTWATAVVALQMGMPRWWGMAFTLNVGFLSELNISGAGVVAAAAAFGAVALTLRGRLFMPIALLAVAALSRESMLVVAGGTAFWLWRFRKEPRRAVLAWSIPLGALLLWAVYLRLRLGWAAGIGEVREVGLPFRGWLQVFPHWLSSGWLSVVTGLAFLTLTLSYGIRVVVSRDLVGWAFCGFVALAVMMTERVWLREYDILRAMAPAFTAYMLLTFARLPSKRVVA